MSDEPPSSQPHEARPSGPFGRFFSARPQGSPYPKAELLPRLLARLTDLILAGLLPLLFGEPGLVVAVLYLLFADGMLRGQSPGKKLLGIKVLHVPSRRDASYRESALRNFPFAVALLAAQVPEFGPSLFWILGPAVLGLEGWQVLGDALGLRLGDLFGQTQVVDTKVLVGAAVRPLLKAVDPVPERVRAARVLLEPGCPGERRP